MQLQAGMPVDHTFPTSELPVPTISTTSSQLAQEMRLLLKPLSTPGIQQQNTGRATKRLFTYPLQRHHHGCLAAHAVPDQDTPAEVQLAEEEVDVGTHGFIRHERAVGAVAVVTGVHRQHLTGQEKRDSSGLAQGWLCIGSG